MAHAPDTPLLHQAAHSPSWFALQRALRGRRTDLVDFCVPCNPYFPTAPMLEQLRQGMVDILTYHPSDSAAITAEACAALGLNPRTVAMGNGSTELTTWIDRLLLGESVAVPVPTFGRWTDRPMKTGRRVDMFPLREEDGFRLDVDAFVGFVRQRGSRAAVVCNPNTPDGNHLPRSEVLRLLDALGGLDLVVVDESFVDFTDAEPAPSVADQAVLRPNAVVLRSLDENFGLHGVRLGCLVANPALAGTVRGALPRGNLNSFAQALVFLLRDHLAEYRESLRLVARDRRAMFQNLQAVPGLGVLPSQANFLLTRLPEGVDGGRLRDALLAEHGVLIRECGDRLGMSSRFLQLVVRPVDDQRRLVSGMLAVLYGAGAAPGWPTAPLPAALPAPAQLPPGVLPQVAVPQIAVQQMPMTALPPYPVG
ncbi:pyridoxal phosphate-dependent aminotransferase [Streptacidiphilus griseoplanus]|uniref:pyridoxal phosphate-dependent aminotransferase n=1 Tax=Peterkaempfera griseoplana TaxID=66896 RepID=UPI0006E39113|nr:aminotransferase class I/II-fold pyridoxal phosphate-dependent enzyme [Peterkaempfera griseoplana]